MDRIHTPLPKEEEKRRNQVAAFCCSNLKRRRSQEAAFCCSNPEQEEIWQWQFAALDRDKQVSQEAAFGRAPTDEASGKGCSLRAARWELQRARHTCTGHSFVLRYLSVARGGVIVDDRRILAQGQRKGLLLYTQSPVMVA